MEIAAFVFSAISLVIAILSFILSFKSQHLQDRVNEIELKLKKYELEEKEKEQHKEPCIEARIVHVSKGNYKIKIWNSGNAVARNVMATWDNKSQIIYVNHGKMPFESLEPQKHFDLAISTYFGSPSKLCITTSWDGIDGQKHNKEQWCDL